MATLLPNGKQAFTGPGGLPLIGGKLYTYVAGTDTPLPTYADAAGTIPNTNPVVLDARGEATVFWDGNYKVTLKDALGNLIWTQDNVRVPSITAATLADFKNEPVSNVTGVYDGSLWRWVIGNYTGRADDVAIIASNKAPLTVGAWIRQDAFIADVTKTRFAGGAKADGITNDAPAIQAAIDYVAARGGGTVRIPVGRYALGMRFIASPFFGFFALELKPGVCLEGEDKYGSYLRIMDGIPGVGPGAPFVPILGQVAMQNVTVRNLTIDGNRQAQAGLDPNNPNNQPPSNGGTVIIGNYDSAPIANVLVENIRSLNAYGQGVQVFGQNSQLGRNVRVHQCDVIGPGYIGIQVSRCDSVSITDNYLESTGDNAIDIYGDSGSVESVEVNTIISNNRMKSCLRGIFPETTMFCLVEGNTIDGSDEGIHCNQIVSAPHSIIIQGNTIRRTRAPLVFSGAFNTVLVMSNLIVEYTYAAFTVGFTSGQCSGVVFDRNMVWPTDNTVPVFFVPPGTVFLSAIKFGTTYLTERNGSSPTPASLFFVGTATFQNVSSYPAVMSITNPGRDKPEAFLDYPVLNQPKVQVSVYASNAAATAAGLTAGCVYSQVSGGPLYYVV